MGCRTTGKLTCPNTLIPIKNLKRTYNISYIWDSSLTNKMYLIIHDNISNEVLKVSTIWIPKAEITSVLKCEMTFLNKSKTENYTSASTFIHIYKHIIILIQ